MSIVIPVQGEVGRYRVTFNVTQHLCDILTNERGCADWVCRQRAHKEKTGLPMMCKHIRAAREFALNDYIEVMRSHLPKQSATGQFPKKSTPGNLGR